MEWIMKTLEWLKRCLRPKLDRNTASLEQVLREIRRMKQALQDLTDVVSEQTTVIQSAVVLISGLADKIAAANAEDDSAAIEQLVTQMRASIQPLSAAVQANTPPSPTPDPVPVDPVPVDPVPVDPVPVDPVPTPDPAAVDTPIADGSN